MARLTPNSGAGKIKGDIHTSEYLIEHKFTEAKQFILKLEMLRQTENQAREAGKTPAWILTMQGIDYTITKGIH